MKNNNKNFVAGEIQIAKKLMTFTLARYWNVHLI